MLRYQRKSSRKSWRHLTRFNEIGNHLAYPISHPGGGYVEGLISIERLELARLLFFGGSCFAG
jgi:hypothetical protein